MWTLIIVISGYYGSAVESVYGFDTRANCVLAAKDIANQSVITTRTSKKGRAYMICVKTKDSNVQAK